MSCFARLIGRVFQVLNLRDVGETSVAPVDLTGDLTDFAARSGNEICRTKLASHNGKVEDQVCSLRSRVGVLAGRTDSGHRHSKGPKIGH